MGALDGRVAIITGAGRGIGREHALLFAKEGASVVVNDNGCNADGTGTDPAVANAVADEISAAGGSAIADATDVSSLDGAQHLLDAAIEAFGDVHAVVNNAGVLRDKMVFSMSEDDWDTVINGHLKTTFCMTRVAGAHWRAQTKAGTEVNAAIVNTSSTSGLIGQVGQSNYGAAKSAIATFSIITAQELSRSGVRVNAISPAARTRMTEDSPGTADLVKAPDAPDGFDVYSPHHPAPLVGWLCTADCPVTGRVFMVKGGDIRWWTPWIRQDFLSEQKQWTIAEIAQAMTDLPPMPVSP